MPHPLIDRFFAVLFSRCRPRCSTQAVADYRIVLVWKVSARRLGPFCLQVFSLACSVSDSERHGIGGGWQAASAQVCGPALVRSARECIQAGRWGGACHLTSGRDTSNKSAREWNSTELAWPWLPPPPVNTQSQNIVRHSATRKWTKTMPDIRHLDLPVPRCKHGWTTRTRSLGKIWLGPGHRWSNCRV